MSASGAFTGWTSLAASLKPSGRIKRWDWAAAVWIRAGTPFTASPPTPETISTLWISAARTSGRVDAQTGKIKLLPTPTRNSHPRRGHMDAQDRLWFAQYLGDKVAMLDTKNEKFTEWGVPTKWKRIAQPLAVAAGVFALCVT